MKRILAIISFLSFMSILGSFAQEQTVPRGDIQLRIFTNKGSIAILLYGDTPAHQQNFLALAEQGAFRNLLFHRVIKNFMIQAGGRVLNGDSLAYSQLEKKYNELIPAEILYPKYYNGYGAIAAARTSNQVNPERKSSPLQFYIVTGKCFLDIELDKMEKEKGIVFSAEARETYKTEGGAPHLDNEYTVFGKVVQGMDVVEKIQRLSTDDKDEPLKPVYIKEVRRL